MTQNKKNKGPFQFLQFSVIGVSNAGIDIGTLNLLLLLFHTDERGLLLLFNTIAYTLAVANSYFWNASFTFQHSAKGSNRQRILFIVQGIVSLGVNNLVFIASNTLLESFGVPNWLRYNVAKGLAMLLSFIASFFMIKYFVFKKSKKN
ncbi:Putative flippase GtrA (transmembrane translocase of bactoprenol-linked glucose) [Virgibacillus subterraneus]|uniref:Flippase GtrA (Transmembrane translocase of bactoprenol-linked glucose) n=1 Tax=Virgibacillus subterraneus TaxID=621109 RepID=A0A1H9K033_9BACI|nr:GtrA family protein [Virgibacillus subterraneus]SEQ92449.1 Putative flippase GtrA (transmembrane translocase of bactoprenol-linked glucose) [Virgibacillus subterraneus]